MIGIYSSTFAIATIGAAQLYIRIEWGAATIYFFEHGLIELAHAPANAPLTHASVARILEDGEIDVKLLERRL